MGHRGQPPDGGKVGAADAWNDRLVGWDQAPFSLASRPDRSSLHGRTGPSVGPNGAHGEKQVDVAVFGGRRRKRDRGERAPLRIGDAEHRRQGVVGSEGAKAGRRLGVGHYPAERGGRNVIAFRCGDILAEQPGDSCAERLGKAAESVATRLAFAALDLGDETLADTRLVGKLALGKASRETSRLDAVLSFHTKNSCSLFSRIEISHLVIGNYRSHREGIMASIVGSNIRRLHKQSGSSRYRLAELACPSQSWICRIESGDQNNTLASLTRIARALPVEGADLLREAAERGA